MRHIVFTPSDTYPIALLIKSSAFSKHELVQAYIEPLVQQGVAREECMCITAEYASNGKAPVKFIKEYLEQLLPALDTVGTQYLYCADAAYFKVLTKQAKAEAHLGYVLPCKIKGYEHLQVILGVNHKSLIHNPANTGKLSLSLNTLADAVSGNYTPIGDSIIHYEEYPSTLEDIAKALNNLHQYPYLAADIEAFSLDFDKAGIGTITFCWSQHEGIAFACDYSALAEPLDGYYGEYVPNLEVRKVLRDFLESYRGNLRWHAGSYDLKPIILNLWMKDLLDTPGLLNGLEVMTGNIHDTKLLTYLATNSCAGNKLSLKDQAHAFAGNWAQEEIKDIRKIPLDALLRYNLVDGLATNYTFDKHFPELKKTNQETIYYEQMLPSLRTNVQMEMTGMPLNPGKVKEARKKLESIVSQQEKILANPEPGTPIAKVEAHIQRKAMVAANAKLKTKQHPLSKFSDLKFNPNSGLQLQVLLYDILGLPELDYTDTGQPATGAKTLEKLEHHTACPNALAMLAALRAHAKAHKILNTFIVAFEKAINKGQEVVWLHGNFNLGGTKSGRLSSSDPNLQNLPSGSTYGKLIKACFMAPKGWLFCGADFNSLEDYISALTTKDPAKLKVYLKGYDGHGLRAFSYWPAKFPYDDITPALSHAMKKEPMLDAIRSASKGPTFALTYQGTAFTLVNTLGFSEEEAKRIEANYHELYKVSDEWVQGKLDQAAEDGYVTVAFGLRLRTPMLGRTLRNSRYTPYEAKAEGRTAGNALGQSYGMLTNRAANAFMQKVWNSPYRYDILPVAMIHDAIYLVIKDSIEVVEWVNRELIQEMQWQELPEIQHDTVKLGAELDIFYPSWATPMTLPNSVSRLEIRDRVKSHLQALEVGEKKAA